MLRFHTVRQSQAIEQFAIQEKGIPGILLMKRAGLFAFEALQHHFNNPQTIVVFCGTGNNGGDGFIVAQLALLAGMDVQVLLHGNPESIKGDALIAYQEMLSVGITPSSFSETVISQADVVVDGLFGSGLNRTIIGKLAEQIQWLNQADKPVLALDIPSGLQADTGAILGHAIYATHTCTFITQKLGLYTFQGSDTAGKVHYSRLYLPLEVIQNQPPIAFNHSLKHWMNKLPVRLASQHKGLAGTVCLVGGNHSMMGAIQLAALASLKVGAGLVKVITHAEHAIAITQSIPELMCYSPEDLITQANLANVVGIGPGLGLDDWGKQLYQKVLDVPLPKVIDADALKLLALNPQNNAHWVLTPHPGEAALLLNTSTDAIQADRVQAIKALQHKYGGVIVLKGNGSLIYDGQNMEICLAGNPGMAVGGMGDVLTGTIATFIAQDLSLWDAACLGVSLHAHAGDVLGQQKGQPGILPSELASVMSQLMNYRD